MLTLNPFLMAGRESKGGGRFLEDPASVQNIACQTVSAAPDAFEAQLADTLMAIFSDGVWDLDRVVAELEARGCRDSGGSAWTTASFQQQLERSASRLFAAEAEPPHG